MHRNPVRQIMHTPVTTIHPDELTADAAELMEEYGLRRLPVVDEDGYLVGIVTDADILEAETAESMFSSLEPGVEEEWLAVADVMTRDVIVISPDATVGQLVTLMMERKIGGVPVVQSSSTVPGRMEVLGMVTETDIFQMIVEAWRLEEARRAAEE